MYAITINTTVRKIKRLIVGLAATAALISSTLPAGAAGPVLEPGHERTAYQSLHASSYTCTPDGGVYICDDVLIGVYLDETGAGDACVTIESTSDDYAHYSYEYGCAAIAAGTLNVGKKLSSITLPPTAVQLVSYDCSYDDDCVEENSRVVTVATDLQASGDPYTFHNKGKYVDSEGCSYTMSSKGEGRYFTGTTTVDGTTTNTTYASFVRSATAYKVSC